ncbi:MAG: M48 family metallopeptidase [Paracoccaceae bacterium]
MRAQGRYFDGQSGKRQQVDVLLDLAARVLYLSNNDSAEGQITWPLAALRRLPESARQDQMTLARHTDNPPQRALIGPERLIVTDPDFMRALQTACPDLTKRDVAKGTGARVVMRVALAVGAVLMMVFVILPSMADSLARFIPVEREIRWGKTVVSQMEAVFDDPERSGALYCTAPEGRRALDKMIARLTNGTDLAYDLTVSVFNHPMVNAFAAPGGQIVLMRGLIKKAGTPEEVAAVLAHEIAHVEHRDATRATLRAAGSAGLLSMVLGDFAGGSIAVVMAELTLNASYTREAETAADAYAHAMLDEADVTVAGMRLFFEALSESSSQLRIPPYLASHPATETRAQAARDYAETQNETTPVLTQTEWAALKTICD